MRLKELATSSKDMFLIPLELLKDDVYNPREDYSNVPNLAVSMFNMGQLEVCEVRVEEDIAIITAGHRRKRAAIYVNEHYDEWMEEARKNNPDAMGFHFRDGLLCKAEPKGLTEVTRVIRQLNQGDPETLAVPLNPIERAKVYRRLIDKGITLAAIGQAVRKSAQHVASALALIEAPKELQEAVEQGKVSATAATKIAKASPEKQEEAMKKIEAGEEVKVKDLATYAPLSLKDATRVAKKYRNYGREEKSEKDRAKWEALAEGVEIGAGLRPDEY